MDRHDANAAGELAADFQGSIRPSEPRTRRGPRTCAVAARPGSLVTLRHASVLCCVMSAVLVADPETLGAAVAEFNAALEGFRYREGN